MSWCRPALHGVGLVAATGARHLRRAGAPDCVVLRRCLAKPHAGHDDEEDYHYEEEEQL